MSRIAKKPLQIPAGVKFHCQDREVQVEGKKGKFSYQLHPAVTVEIEGNVVFVKPLKGRHAMVGTTCKLLSNFLQGASEGFEKKITLVGVGYRAKIQGHTLELSLGYSNPILYEVPKGITIEVPSNTEIFVKGTDRQLVGETAAKIRGFRPPEPYKGKGARYANEVVAIKETKKK